MHSAPFPCSKWTTLAREGSIPCFLGSYSTNLTSHTFYWSIQSLSTQHLQSFIFGAGDLLLGAFIGLAKLAKSAKSNPDCYTRGGIWNVLTLCWGWRARYCGHGRDLLMNKFILLVDHRFPPFLSDITNVPDTQATNVKSDRVWSWHFKTLTSVPAPHVRIHDPILSVIEFRLEVTDASIYSTIVVLLQDQIFINQHGGRRFNT